MGARDDDVARVLGMRRTTVNTIYQRFRRLATEPNILGYLEAIDKHFKVTWKHAAPGGRCRRSPAVAQAGTPADSSDTTSERTGRENGEGQAALQ